MNSRENKALVFARDYLSEQPGIHYWVSLDVVLEYYLLGDLLCMTEEERPYTGAEYAQAMRVLDKLKAVYAEAEEMEMIQ